MTIEPIFGPCRVALVHAASGEVQHVFDLAGDEPYFAPDLMVAVVDPPADLVPGAHWQPE